MQTDNQVVSFKATDDGLSLRKPYLIICVWYVALALK
jgi:hypothetical protein